jgi:hypothetical protein
VIKRARRAMIEPRTAALRCTVCGTWTREDAWQVRAYLASPTAPPCDCWRCPYCGANHLEQPPRRLVEITSAVVDDLSSALLFPPRSS